jgi:hypothetical protein
MNWLLFAIAILAGEILLVLLFWENIAEFFGSYTFLYDKGEKAYQAGRLEKALSLFLKTSSYVDFKKLPEEHPLKLAVCQNLADLYFELAIRQFGQGEKNYGRQYLVDALTYKVKELQLRGEWEGLQENHPEIKDIRLKLAGAYRYSNFDLPEALKIFFGYGHWEDYIGTFYQLKNQLVYLSFPSEEKSYIEEQAELAREIIKYRQGVSKILEEGNKDGKMEVDRALEAVGRILNNSPNFLQIEEPLFNEIKEKLGHAVAAELQGDLEAEGGEDKGNQDELLENQEEETRETLAATKVEHGKASTGTSWEVIVKQLQKQSRVVSKVTQRPGEVAIEVQTEWYLLPLIFQEELVEKAVRVFYALSKKKAGSVCFVFRDNKGREVARHTQLGVRVYK